MAQIANITVFDGAATPVSHTLVPISVTRENGKVDALWREVLASVPAYASVRCNMQIEQLKSGIWRVMAQTVVPVMESVSGQNSAGYTAAPKTAFEDRLDTVGYFSPRSTQTSRRLVRQLHVNLLGNISTSVAAATSGFAPDLIDSLVAPT